jgi:hypothetical protein
MFWWIVAIILIIIIILLVYSSTVHNVVGDFIRSPEVRNLTSSFALSVIKPAVLSQCTRLNPYLTPDQVSQLDDSLAKIIGRWKEGQPIEPLIRPLMALALPYGDHIHDIVRAFTRFYSNYNSNANDGKQNNGVIPTEIKSRGDDKKTDQPVSNHALILHSQFGCSKDIVNEMNPKIRTELFKLLYQSKNLNCGITLEELMINKRLVPGVAMITKKNGDKYHVFLFKRDALFRWFRSKPTNPMTRETVDSYTVLS